VFVRELKKNFFFGITAKYTAKENS